MCQRFCAQMWKWTGLKQQTDVKPGHWLNSKTRTKLSIWLIISISSPVGNVEESRESPKTVHRPVCLNALNSTLDNKQNWYYLTDLTILKILDSITQNVQSPTQSGESSPGVALGSIPSHGERPHQQTHCSEETGSGAPLLQQSHIWSLLTQGHVTVTLSLPGVCSPAPQQPPCEHDGRWPARDQSQVTLGSAWHADMVILLLITDQPWLSKVSRCHDSSFVFWNAQGKWKHFAPKHSCPITPTFMQVVQSKDTVSFVCNLQSRAAPTEEGYN